MKAKISKPASQPSADQSATAVTMPAPTPETAKADKVLVAKSAKAAAAKAAGKSATTSEAQNEKSAVAKTLKTKTKKQKLVRDSFTMPENEYAMLAETKRACLQAGFEVKKSQLLRIGISTANALDTASLRQRLDTLAPLKPGRPKAS